MTFTLERATDGVHKWIGVFADGTRVPFGAKGYQDYTQHKDPLRQKLYLTRHRVRENWNDPKTAGALSRWILWDSPTLQTNLRNFKRRFNLH